MKYIENLYSFLNESIDKKLVLDFFKNKTPYEILNINQYSTEKDIISVFKIKTKNLIKKLSQYNNLDKEYDIITREIALIQLAKNVLISPQYKEIKNLLLNKELNLDTDLNSTIDYSFYIKKWNKLNSIISAIYINPVLSFNKYFKIDIQSYKINYNDYSENEWIIKFVDFLKLITNEIINSKDDKFILSNDEPSLILKDTSFDENFDFLLQKEPLKNKLYITILFESKYKYTILFINEIFKSFFNTKSKIDFKNKIYKNKHIFNLEN